MDTRKSNKKKKNLVDYPNTDSEEEDDITSNSEDDDDSETVSLDIEEITKIAIQELMMDEDFQKEIFKPMIMITSLQGNREDDDNEDEIPQRNEDPYLQSLPDSKKRKLREVEKKVMESKKLKVPLKYKILESDITINGKRTILEKLEHYQTLMPTSSEFNKLSKYFRILEKVPFGKYSKLPVTKKCAPEKITEFMKNLYKNLSLMTYGQEEAKSNILEVVAKWISNPSGEGNVIGLCGPPGIGKTSLIKNGLSKSLQMPFSFMGLGGATCSASLQGHDYTYEGSKCGRIVEMLIETGTMNPIIFFDELDKVSETKNGEEIIGLLTHLTDPSQNNSFHDKYFSGIDFDLSKCFFIFSFNDESKINPILKDRIKIINLKGFETKEKIEIAKKYSIPKICNNIGFDEKDIELEDEVLKSVIDNYAPESGVRKLERCIETLIMKLNLYNMTQDPKNLSRKEDIELQKPYKLNTEQISLILDSVFERTGDFDSIYKYTMYS